VQTLLSRVLKLLVAYLVFLIISTIISFVFIRTSDYTPSIISDLGPRVEIILIFFTSLFLNYRQLKSCFLGFTLGFAFQFLQSLYTLLYNLRITSSPIFMSSLLVDESKYDYLLPNTYQLGANRIAELASDGFSFIRASSLIGEPTIFGIYSALCFSIFLFTPSYFSYFFLNKLSRSILVFMAFFCCMMSGSKTSLLLLIAIPFLYYLPMTMRLITSLKFSRYLLTLVLIPLIILISLSFFSQNIFLSRFITDSGHLDHLFATFHNLLDSEHISDLFIGTGSGVAASKHRFFITQMTEVGIVPGFMFCTIIFAVFYDYAIDSCLTNNTSNSHFTRRSASITPVSIILIQFSTCLLIYDPFNHPVLWYTLILGINTLSPNLVDNRAASSSNKEPSTPL